MNQKMLEAVVLRVRQVLTEWPPGTVVWLLSTGKRGVVGGCEVCGDGTVLTRVLWGEGSGLHYPFELRKKRVPENFDGEEWKAGLEDPPGAG